MLLAAAQVHAVPLDVGRNLDTLERLVFEAARAGVRLVVFPELFLTGATFSNALWHTAPTPEDAHEQRLAAIARSSGVHIVVGTAERRDRHLYNTALLVAPGRPITRYSKMHLFATDAFAFRPGAGPFVWDTALGRIGIGICYDMLFATPWNAYVGAVDLVAIPSAWPDFGQARTRLLRVEVPLPLGALARLSREWIEELPRRISQAVGVPVIYSNHVGSYEVELLIRGAQAPLFFPPTSAIHDGMRMVGLPEGEGLAIGQVVLDGPRSPSRPYAGVCKEPQPLGMRLALGALDTMEGAGVFIGYPAARALALSKLPARMRRLAAPFLSSNGSSNEVFGAQKTRSSGPYRWLRRLKERTERLPLMYH